MKYHLTVQGKSFEIEVGAISGGMAEITVDNAPFSVKIENLSAAPAGPSAQPIPAVTRTVSAPKSASAPVRNAEVVMAPIPGIILSIAVNVGDTVTPGQVVAIMEAMKMENNLLSHTSGSVKEIRAPKGTEVATGDVVIVIG